LKYKTLFRLMLKAVGVLLFVQGFAWSLPQLVPYALQALLKTAVAGPPSTPSLYAVGPVIQAIVGLYLFFGGEWLVNKAIPSNKPYCHECGYDLSGAASNRCPECDTPFRPEDVEPPRVRS
jgi:hypothetical protein